MRELKKPYGDSLILGYSKENILKVISIIEKFMPPDDYILTYKDFLKHKDFMIYIGFNIKVYESLVNLIYELWDSGKRINRLYLLTILKRYNKKNPHPGDINEETASRLFHIFKQIIFIQNCKNNIKTYEKLKISINSVMLDVKLNENQLAWMCDKTETSDIIIKRTLWYKYKSDAISQWAINNYNKDYLRKYRAELTGWILDKDNTLVVEPQTLIDDFEYANKLDMQLIQKYKEDLLDHQLKEDLAKTFAVKLDIEYPIDKDDPIYDVFHKPRSNIFDPPVLNLKGRFYDGYINIDYWKIHKEMKEGNFESYRKVFIDNIGMIQKITMIYAIGFSRLDNKIKTKLLKKYYEKKFNYAFFKICIMNRNVELLKWLYENGE